MAKIRQTKYKYVVSVTYYKKIFGKTHHMFGFINKKMANEFLKDVRKKGFVKEANLGTLKDEK